MLIVLPTVFIYYGVSLPNFEGEKVNWLLSVVAGRDLQNL